MQAWNVDVVHANEDDSFVATIGCLCLRRIQIAFEKQYADPKYLTDAGNVPSITWLRRLWHSIRQGAMPDLEISIFDGGLVGPATEHQRACGSIYKNPSHQSFGCSMPRPIELQYMLEGEIGVP